MLALHHYTSWNVAAPNANSSIAPPAKWKSPDQIWLDQSSIDSHESPADSVIHISAATNQSQVFIDELDGIVLRAAATLFTDRPVRHTNKYERMQP